MRTRTDPGGRRTHHDVQSPGEKSLSGGNARLKFAPRPLTYQRFRQNAVSESAYGPFMDLITTTSELAAACARLAEHPVITVDTEFLRETTYYPLLCVVQMASPPRSEERRVGKECRSRWSAYECRKEGR